MIGARIFQCESSSTARYTGPSLQSYTLPGAAKPNSLPIRVGSTPIAPSVGNPLD